MICELNFNGKRLVGNNPVEVGYRQLKHMLSIGQYKNRDNIIADIEAYEFILKYGLEESYLHVRDRYKDKTARFILEVMKREAGAH